jgi:alginate O-acetyltransferase complex protein AlgJ
MDSPPTINRIASRLDAVLVALFACALAAPHVDHLVRADAARDCLPERRFPAARPEAPPSLDAVRTFVSRYEAFWNDTFGLRDILLGWNTVFKLVTFGVTPSAEYIAGSAEPWIFYAGNRALDDHRGIAPFSGDELATWQTAIESHRDAATRAGAKYAFVICPDKHTIYPEFLTSEYDRVGPSRREQFVAWMREKTSVEIIDLTAGVLRAKRDDAPGDYAYFEAGTHWQGRGAREGARELAARLESLLPDHDFDTFDQLELRRIKPRGETELDRMYARNFYGIPIPRDLVLREFDSLRETRLGANPRESELTRVGARGPRATVFHDSFEEGLHHWFASAFRSTHLVWTPAFDAALVARDRPDIVLEVFVERIFTTTTPARPPPYLDPRLEVAHRDAGKPLLILDLASESPQLTPTEGASAIREDGPNGATLVLETKRVAATFALPRVTPRTARYWVVLIELDAPQATTLELLVPRNGKGYGDASIQRVPLDAGPNRRFLAFDASGVDDVLRLRPGDVAGRFVLRRFDLREVELPR